MKYEAGDGERDMAAEWDEGDEDDYSDDEWDDEDDLDDLDDEWDDEDDPADDVPDSDWDLPVADLHDKYPFLHYFKLSVFDARYERCSCGAVRKRDEPAVTA